MYVLIKSNQSNRLSARSRKTWQYLRLVAYTYLTSNMDGAFLLSLKLQAVEFLLFVASLVAVEKV